MISRQQQVTHYLSFKERLELKAEIMGHPDNLIRAYLGGSREAAKVLDEYESAAQNVVGSQQIPHAPGVRILRRLEEMGAPDFVIEDVRERIEPEYVAPARITHRQSGLEARNKRAQSLFNLRLFKPKTAEVLRQTRLSKQELYRRAGIGRETLRKALYLHCGNETAQKIASVLGEELDLSEGEREAIREELVHAPQKEF